MIRVEPMPKVSERERIAALEEKLKQLKVRQQRKEARERSIATRRTRAQELRRKILVGAVVLAQVEAKEFEESVLRGWMEKALTRADDRAQFGLDGAP